MFHHTRTMRPGLVLGGLALVVGGFMPWPRQPQLLAAPPGSIETVAGTGNPSNNGNSGVALKINVGDPFGVEIGPDGALYVTEVRNHRVRRLDLETGN